MQNHFHLVIETPQANLVAGMKWQLGVYTKRFNIRQKLCGHLFAGRYKALIVDGSGDGYPFIAYGTDWLAFAHFVIAIAFIGPWRDPVRNVWVVECMPNSKYQGLTQV